MCFFFKTTSFQTIRTFLNQTINQPVPVFGFEKNLLLNIQSKNSQNFLTAR